MILVAILVFWSYVRYDEAKQWNYGISRKTGKPWVPFDTDSSGATGYCDGSGNTIWM